MSARMKEDALGGALDTCTGVGREPVRRLEVLGAMAGRRRSWTLEQKLAIVAEAEHCDNLTSLARRHDIRTSQLYTWRRELRYAMEAGRSAKEAEPMFVPAVAAGAVPTARPGDIAIEVEIGGAVVRITRVAKPDLAAAVVQALQALR
jgi:transposase